MFGLPMTLGAGFTPEQYASEGLPVVVISRRAWRDFFNSDPNVVGKPTRFPETAPTIVGVAPQDLDMPRGADFWFNLRLGPQDVGHNFDGYMRLKPGGPVGRPPAERAGVMGGVAGDFPASAINRGYVVKPLVDQIIGDLGPILIVVLS